jgi:hypothetical protein
MNRIQWERKVPFYKNRFILRGILFSVGIPFGGMLALVIILLKGNIIGSDAKYIIAMIGVFSFLCTLLALTLSCSRYAPGFIVDEEGIVNFIQKKQAKKNKVYNLILVIFGLFRGSYNTTGIGLAPQTKKVMKLEWKDMRKARYFPKQYAIMVKGGFTETLVVFCTKGNYEAVVQKIKKKMNPYAKI